MRKSFLPGADDSSLVVVVCLAVEVAMVLRKPPEETPVDCFVQPSTPTMHSSVMERSGGDVVASDTMPEISIFTLVPGDSEIFHRLSRMMV